MEHQLNPKIQAGVFAVIFDNKQRVLLCHRRDHDLWNLPGGVLEKGEAPWEGVRREVREETGLEVEVVRLTGIYYKPEQNEVVFSFLCKITKGEITLTDEADRIEYFEFQEIPSNSSPKQIERIKDVLESEGCTMQTQIGPSAIEMLKNKNQV